jgi:hypothetical protein
VLEKIKSKFFGLNKKSLKILAFFFVLYHSIFNSYTFNYFTPQFLNPAQFHFKFEYVSLFFGVEIIDIKVKPISTSFKNELLKAKFLKLRYNLIQLLYGKIKLGDIELKEPIVFLEKVDSKWNFQNIIEESKEEKKKETEPLEKIHTKLPIKIYLGLLLDSANISIRSNDFESDILGLNLQFQLESFRFSELPLNLDSIDLVKYLKINMNPNSTLSIKYKDKDILFENSIDSKIQVEIQEKYQIQSKIQLGNSDLNFKIKDKEYLKKGINLSLESKIDTEKDKIELNTFQFNLDKEEQISLNGSIENYLSDKRKFFLNTNSFQLNLEKLNPYLGFISSTKESSLAGKLEIQKLVLNGDSSNLSIILNSFSKNIYYKTKNKTHSVSLLNLNLNSELDLNSNNLEIPFLKKLETDSELNYNFLSLKLKGIYDSKNDLDLLLNVNRFHLGVFFNKLNGFFSGEIKAKGKMKDLNLLAKFNLDSFEYFVENSKSAPIFSKLNLNSNLKLKESFQIEDLNFQTLSLKIYNKTFEESLNFTSIGKIKLQNDLEVSLDKLSLKMYMSKFIPSLPLSLKEKFITIKNITSESPELTGKINYKKSKTLQDIDLSLELKLPGINLKDSRLISNISLAENLIQIKNFSLKAYKSTLDLDLKGKIELNEKLNHPILKNLKPDITARMELKSESPYEIYNRFFFKGFLSIDINFSNYLLNTNFASLDTTLLYSKGECQGVVLKNCKVLNLNSINFQFPFTHDFTVLETKNLLEGNKSKFITDSTSKKPNFTIKNIFYTLPFVTNPVEVVQFKESNGLSMNIESRDNLLFLNAVRIFSLDGIFYSKSIMLNLGNLDPNLIEYDGNISIRDIDLKQLISERTRDRIQDGKLKADLNFSGKGLLDPLQNSNIYFSVHQIGEDFGKSVVRVVSTSTFWLDIIISSYSQIDKIQLELSRGLVYSDILFKGAIIPRLLARFKDNEISQERLPIANFLKKAESELGKYE